MDGIEHKLDQRQCSLSDLCEIYSLFLQTPTADFVGGLVNGAIFEDLNEILLELKFIQAGNTNSLIAIKDYCSTRTVDDLLHELRVEYTRLFIKTSKDPEVPIYESVFKNSANGTKDLPLLFVNDEALDLTEIYRKVGLVRSTRFNNSEDHFAFQFIFLAKIHLILGVVESEQEVMKFIEILEKYNQRHFSKWALDFFVACEAKTQSKVYRVLWKLGYEVSKRLLLIDSVCAI